MGKFQLAATLLVLGVFGASAAVVPLKQLSFKTPGAVVQRNSTLGMYKGETTNIKKHPYMVGLLYNGEFSGAATIISNKYVLTSADVVQQVDPSELQVVAGSKDGSSGTKFAVSDIITHPSYGAAFLDYDFALLKIKKKFSWSAKVKKAKLPSKKTKSGATAVVAGWGSSDSDGTMLQGKMSFITNAKCQKYYQDAGLTMTDRLGCTYNKGKTTLCNGDWADPFITNGVIHQFFVAIGTSGQCSSSAGPCINADVFSVKSWIKKNTKVEEDGEDGVEEEDEDVEEDEEFEDVEVDEDDENKEDDDM